MNKKRKLLSPVFSIVLALAIGFAATYSLYYFSVDCYKYSENKNALSFEDLGSIFSDNSSALSTFIKKGNNFSIEEEQEALKCPEDAKYTELPLEKAFPMYWAVFRNKNQFILNRIKYIQKTVILPAACDNKFHVGM